ncbi:MAG: hypothetical protein JRD89_15220 [Deltaproteobacteria bacterium]|nr:hypothetical protein [Deltaproteobacteria bacterium]
MEGDEVHLKEIADELRKLRSRIKWFAVSYIGFWSLVILLIHLVMIPAIKGG